MARKSAPSMRPDHRLEDYQRVLALDPDHSAAARGLRELNQGGDDVGSFAPCSGVSRPNSRDPHHALDNTAGTSSSPRYRAEVGPNVGPCRPEL